MKLEDPRKTAEDFYSDQQLQMRPLLDVMINRSVWEEVTARGEHAVLEASNVIERSELFYCLKQNAAVENYLLNHTPFVPLKKSLPAWKDTCLDLFNLSLNNFMCVLTLYWLFKLFLAPLPSIPTNDQMKEFINKLGEFC